MLCDNLKSVNFLPVYLDPKTALFTSLGFLHVAEWSLVWGRVKGTTRAFPSQLCPTGVQCSPSSSTISPSFTSSTRSHRRGRQGTYYNDDVVFLSKDLCLLMCSSMYVVFSYTILSSQLFWAVLWATWQGNVVLVHRYMYQAETRLHRCNSHN